MSLGSAEGSCNWPRTRFPWGGYVGVTTTRTPRRLLPLPPVPGQGLRMCKAHGAVRVIEAVDKVGWGGFPRTATWRRTPARGRSRDPRGRLAQGRRSLPLEPQPDRSPGQAGVWPRGAALGNGWVRRRAGSRAHFQHLFGSPYRHPRGDPHPEALSWSDAIAIELVREQVAFVVFLEDVSPICAPETACEGVVGLGKALINPVSECVVETVEGCSVLTGNSRGPA